MLKHSSMLFLWLSSVACVNAELALVPKSIEQISEKRPYSQLEKIPEGYIEEPFNENTPTPVPSAVEKQTGMIIFSRPLTEPIWAETKPLPEERVTALNGWGARGQFVTLNFAVYPLVPLKNLKVRVTSAIQPEIRKVEYWKIIYPYYNSQNKKYRRMPEFLMPLTVSDAPALEPQRYCLTFKIPANAKAGVWDGEIKIFHDNFEKAISLPFMLKVLPFELKQDPEKHYTAYYYDIRDQHSPFYKKNRNDEKLLHESQLKEFQLMIDYGFTRPPGLLLRFNNITNEYYIMNLDKILAELQEAGFKKNALLPICGSAEYYFYQKHTGKKLEEHFINMEKVPSALYQDIDIKLKQFLAKGEKEKWPPMIFNPLDEPSIDAKEFVKQIFKTFKNNSCRTFVTSAPQFFVTECDQDIDVYSNGSFIYPYAQVTSGKKFEYWCYPNDVAYQIKDPSVMCHGGRMTYGYGYWRSGYQQIMPWLWRNRKDEERITNNGGNLLLPDGNVAVTLYWECFRQGVDDLRYIYTLQDAVVKREPASNPQLAKELEEARLLLQHTWDAIPVQPAYLRENIWSHLELDARRAQMADMISSLLKYPETNSKIAPSVIINTEFTATSSNSMIMPDRNNLREFPLTAWMAHEKEASVTQKDDITTLKINVDYKNDGTGLSVMGKHPCGWPRMMLSFDHPGFDMTQYDYLTFHVKVDSDRDGETAYDWPMNIDLTTYNTGKGKLIPLFNRLEPGIWHTMMIPISELNKTGLSAEDMKQISRMQFFISENQYADGAKLEFQFKEIKVIAFRYPAIVEIDCARVLDIPRQNIPYRVKLLGKIETNKYTLDVRLLNAERRLVKRNDFILEYHENKGVFFDIDGFLPGNYTLQIRVLDKTKQQLSQQELPIRLFNGPLTK